MATNECSRETFAFTIRFKFGKKTLLPLQCSTADRIQRHHGAAPLFNSFHTAATDAPQCFDRRGKPAVGIQVSDNADTNVEELLAYIQHVQLPLEMLAQRFGV